MKTSTEVRSHLSYLGNCSNWNDRNMRHAWGVGKTRRQETLERNEVRDKARARLGRTCE